MKKIRIEFCGSIEVDAYDVVLFDMAKEESIKASTLITNGQPIHGPDIVLSSFSDCFQKALDEDFENLSWEIVED